MSASPATPPTHTTPQSLASEQEERSVEARGVFDGGCQCAWVSTALGCPHNATQSDVEAVMAMVGTDWDTQD